MQKIASAPQEQYFNDKLVDQYNYLLAGYPFFARPVQKRRVPLQQN